MSCLCFLKNTKQTFIKSEIFKILQEEEIALKLEIPIEYLPKKQSTATTTTTTQTQTQQQTQQQKKQTQIFFKKITFHQLWEQYSTFQIPFQSISISELIPQSKSFSKFRIVIQNISLHILSIEEIQFFFIKWFVLFWENHPLCKHYPLPLYWQKYFMIYFVDKQKYTIRFMIHGYLFPNSHLKTLFEQFCSFLKNQKISNHSSEKDFFSLFFSSDQNGWIDNKVYEKNATFPICGTHLIQDSSKLGSTSYMYLRKDEKKTCLSFDDFQMLFLTCTKNCKLIPFYDKTIDKGIIVDDPLFQTNWENLFALFQKEIKFAYPDSSFLSFQEKSFIYWNASSSSFLTIFSNNQLSCPFVNKEIKSKYGSCCCQYEINLWLISLKCMDSQCSCNNQHFFIPLTHQWFKKLFYESEYLQDDLHLDTFLKKSKPFPLPSHWRIEYYEEEKARSYFEEKSTPSSCKWIVEQSAMCTQKTTQWIAMVKKELQYHPNLSILIIGPRISFVTHVHSRLAASQIHFLIYNSTEYNNEIRKKQIPKEAIQLVIQYESLWQIEHLKFDLVIVDEINTVLSCTTSPTNKDHLVRNAIIFQYFLQAAKRVLLVDADLNSKCLTFVAHLGKKEEKEKEKEKKNVLVRINSYRKPELHKSFILYNDYPKSFRHPEKDESQNYNGRKQFIASFKDRILKGQRIVFISGSIDFFERDIESWLQQNKIGYKWYKQNSGNEIDLTDIHFYWNKQTVLPIVNIENGRKRKWIEDLNENEMEYKKLQVIAYTNRITVGLSYELNDFDSMYIYGSPGSVVPRLLLQMRGRIRFLQEKSISMYVFPRQDRLISTDFQTIRNHFIIQKTHHHDEPCWLLDQYCYHELEINLSKRNFLLEIVKQLIHHGYSWVFASCFQEHLPTFGDNLEKRVVLDNIPLISYEYDRFCQISISMINEWNTYKPAKNTYERMQQIKAYLIQTFFPSFLNVNKEKNLPYECNELAWTLYRLFSLRKQKILFLNNWYVHTQKSDLLSTETGMDTIPRYEILQELLQQIGFNHLLDFDSLINTKLICDQQDLIKKTFEKYERLCYPNRMLPNRFNLVGMIRKLSKYLMEFSGQSILSCCLICKTILSHPSNQCLSCQKKNKIKIIKKKGRRFYYGIYKLIPSTTDYFIQQLIDFQKKNSI